MRFSGSRSAGAACRTALNEKALAACREALAPMPDVRVRSADCQFSPDAGRLHVRVGLEAGHQNYQLEVTV